MKRYVKATNDYGDLFTIPPETEKLVTQIEQLFKKEDIPYIYVEAIEPGFIVGVTYGDWKNDNDRADYLVEQHFHPDKINYEDKDPYDYLDEAAAERMVGTDSCVTKHEWIWEE